MKPVAETAIPSEELERLHMHPVNLHGGRRLRKLREEIQDLMAQRQNLKRCRITCWGCGGVDHLRSSCPRIIKDHNIKCCGCCRTGHVRSNCPRVNQEDPFRTSVTESKKVCSNRKESADKNGDVRSKRLCSESSKNLSNSLRVEKKFGMIDPVVCQVTTTLHRHWTRGVMRASEKIDCLILK
ncbi:uncharacterized protein TNCV_1560901 [Trichonephila clavipes]|nr:uncharacterized protein TNCV_1560901 [Trichonephila clavipes]